MAPSVRDAACDALLNPPDDTVRWMRWGHAQYTYGSRDPDVIRADRAYQRWRKRLQRDDRVRVDRSDLRNLLLEVQDLRSRQGCDWRWMDSLSLTLRRELRAALAEQQDNEQVAA